MKKQDPAAFEAVINHTNGEKFPHFRVLRLYGETGLTGSEVVDATATTTTAARVRQAFTGSVGAGWGWTMPVSTEKRGDTSAFTILGISRLGIQTIPGVDANPTATPPVTGVPGKLAYNWLAGVRIENEKGGNFEGKYFEIGLGESEQFTHKKVPRLRADLMVPFPGDNKLFRSATRMQFDTPTPFDRKENTDPGGEIRISIVFNIDTQELSRRLGGK